MESGRRLCRIVKFAAARFKSGLSLKAKISPDFPPNLAIRGEAIVDNRYKQMLEGMRTKEKPSPKKRAEQWFLYILKCNDHTLYTGVTKDVERRFKMHSEGKAARYTRTRRPLEVVYQETCKTRTQALVRECVVKALPKHKKLALIEQFEREK